MKYGLVVIGASLGGLQALRTVLSALPGNFPLPLAIVQHRNPDAGDSLQFVLREACALPVQEILDKAPIEPKTVHLAPPNYHLLVEARHFALSTEEPVAFARPSIDILFDSASESFGPRLIGLVLTGTGKDGAQGLASIQRRGGLALVESRKSAMSASMPEAAVDATVNAIELDLAQIGPYLVQMSLL